MGRSTPVDRIEAAQRAESSLRQAIREGHELLADMRQLLREAREVRDTLTPPAVWERVNAEIAGRVGQIAEQVDAEMAASVRHVSEEFDRLAMVLLGEDQPGTEPLADTALRYRRRLAELEGGPAKPATIKLADGSGL